MGPMARPTDDFFELFRKKRVFSIKKVVGPKRLSIMYIEKVTVAVEERLKNASR